MTGTGLLIRLIVRRERWILPLWTALLVLMTAGQAKRYASTFPDPGSLAAFAAQMADNRALLAFAGRIYEPSAGGLVAWRIGDTIYTLIGLMAILTVVRHTRAEEDSGRADLVGAGIVGRYAPLAASLTVSTAASIVTGLLTALGTMSIGAGGAFAFGLGIAVAGTFFGAVAAVAAQLTSDARSAIGLASAVLGLGYLLRFGADASGAEWLKWLSPQGWSHLIRPFADTNPAPALLGLVLAAACCALAGWLRGRRDLGLGLIPQRLGPAANPALTGPFALAWRQQRGLLGGWTAAFAIAGLFFGALATSIPGMTSGGPAAQEFFRRFAEGDNASMTDAYLWLTALSLGYVAALYPMLAVLRLRAEESNGLTELLLATPMTRVRMAGAQFAVAAAGTVVVLLAAGVTMGAAAGDMWRVLGAVLLQAPAVLLIGSVSALAFGLLPRAAAGISWAVFFFVNLFGEVLGPIMKIDYWIANLVVPFHHLPKVLSGGQWAAGPVLAMTTITLAIGCAALAAYRRRDVV
ncbi:ABC transporter permease [Longispora albida]|uniref:ABC transporter permease n=1 Tax=Longispora albida TaxID=203523 RepID=UPI00037A66F9|nr:hypothetical protein [Longispora albida]